MTNLVLEGRLGTKVEIDLCSGCRGIWFDQYESLRLEPGAMLKLFTLIAEQESPPHPVPQTMACPRCGAHLVLTHDMQHATAFQYWRCPQSHGHFIMFLEFLKEKDFVRPLTPAQIADLRQNVQNVQTVNCTNCGGPIDLARGSVCPHCGSPLTMLDMKQMGQMVATLKQAEQQKTQPHAVDPALPLLLERQRLDTERQFAAIGAEGGGQSLVEAGLRQVVRWLVS
jgi:Zn-finger nucleic acid-binding protein